MLGLMLWLNVRLIQFSFTVAAKTSINSGDFMKEREERVGKVLLCKNSIFRSHHKMFLHSGFISILAAVNRKLFFFLIGSVRGVAAPFVDRNFFSKLCLAPSIGKHTI
jgi:hypothetical protein